jgi:hypothetical protein
MQSKALKKIEETCYDSLVAIEESLCDLYNRGVENGTIDFSLMDDEQLATTLEVIGQSITDILEAVCPNPISKEQLDKLEKKDFLKAIGVNFAINKMAERIDIAKIEIHKKGGE